VLDNIDPKAYKAFVKTRKDYRKRLSEQKSSIHSLNNIFP